MTRGFQSGRLPCWTGVDRIPPLPSGDRSIPAGSFQRGVAALLWHTILLARSSVLYILHPPRSEMAQPRRRWLLSGLGKPGRERVPLKDKFSACLCVGGAACSSPGEAKGIQPPSRRSGVLPHFDDCSYLRKVVQSEFIFHVFQCLLFYLFGTAVRQRKLPRRLNPIMVLTGHTKPIP